MDAGNIRNKEYKNLPLKMSVSMKITYSDITDNQINFNCFEHNFQSTYIS